jgi:hypothetical protein
MVPYTKYLCNQKVARTIYVFFSFLKNAAFVVLGISTSIDGEEGLLSLIRDNSTRKNCQCIAQEAVPRCHLVGLGGAVFFRLHNPLYTRRIVLNFLLYEFFFFAAH